MVKYEIMYSKEKLKNVKEVNYIPNQKIYGYLVYQLKNSNLWCWLSFIPCLPICIKEQCIVYQEPIYENIFDSF
jgi:hypothetical protein